MSWAKCSLTNAKIPIYGIKRLLSSSDPAWERTDNAVGFTATASVGTVAGSSSFDKIMPWAGMIRSTFDTGDVMVKIPEFWYRRWQEDGYEYIQIANKKANDQFEKHPGSGRYIGAYETSSNMFSKSGATPVTDLTRKQYRTYATSKGSNWFMADIAVWSAIQMIFLVEYATYDSQTAIGKGFCVNNPGLNKTGSCDTVLSLTGIPEGTNGRVGVVYRGIENPWANAWEFIDGIISSSNHYYVCLDGAKYSDSLTDNYNQISYNYPNSGSSFISRLGFDSSYTWAMLPQEVQGTYATFMCDATAANSNTNTPMHGGSYNWSGDGYNDGIFAYQFNSNTYAYNLSYRLMYM